MSQEPKARKDDTAATAAKRYKKKARPGAIDLHPTQPMIVIQVVETTVDLSVNGLLALALQAFSDLCVLLNFNDIFRLLLE